MRTENTNPLKILYLSAYICVITGSYLIYFGDTEFVFVKAMNSKIQMAILFSIVLVLIFYFRWREIYTSPDYKKKIQDLNSLLAFSLSTRNDRLTYSYQYSFKLQTRGGSTSINN